MTLFRLKRDTGALKAGTYVTPTGGSSDEWILQDSSGTAIEVPNADIAEVVEIDPTRERVQSDTDLETALRVRLGERPIGGDAQPAQSSAQPGQGDGDPGMSEEQLFTPAEPPPSGEPIERDSSIRRRVFSSDDEELSACLDERVLGYLSVEVTFLGEPVAGLDIKLLDSGNTKVANHAPVLLDKTDDFGRYKIDHLVEVGSYYCEIEHQPSTVVTTVEDPEKPFVVVLPIGRPYFDQYLQELP